MTEIGGAALVSATDRFAFALVEIFVFKFVSLTVERWRAPRVINKVEITTAKTKPRGCTSAVFITVISPKIYFLQKDSNYKGGELGKVLRIADCWPVCQWSVVRSYSIRAGNRGNGYLGSTLRLCINSRLTIGTNNGR